MPESEVNRPSMRDLLHLLNAYEEYGAEAAAATLFQVENLGPGCLPELGNRLIRPSVPHALKRFIYGLPVHLPWPQWTPVLQRALLHENDPALFEEGVRGLALMGGAEQTDALRAIAWQRVDEPFKSVVLRKLEWLEPRQDFDYHLKDLLRGGRNPVLAQRSVEHLSLQARAEHLPALIEAASLEDGHVSRLAFRVIACLKDAAAGEFLAARFREMGEAQEVSRLLRDALEPLRRLSPAVQAEELSKHLAEAAADRCTSALEALRSALAQEDGNAAPALAALRNAVQGAYESRLFEALEAVVSDRPGRLAALTAQVAEEIRHSAPRLHGNLNECALGLVQQARHGTLPESTAIGLLEWAYSRSLGGDGVAWAFATLIEAKDTALLDKVLENPDHRFREAALTVLGEREDPELLDFLFKATQDPISDLALRVTQFFGRLPGAFPRTLDLLHSENPDKIRQAFAIIESNGMRSACETLLTMLKEPPREDLLCEGIRILGALRYQPAAADLLRMLHGGQSPRVLSALGGALGVLETPAAALGLLDKAQSIRNSDLQVLALQGLGRVFTSLDDPIPLERLEQVRASLTVCMDESARSRLAAVDCLPNLAFLSSAFYDEQLGVLARLLAEQRKRPTWDRAQLESASLVQRALEQRLEEISSLESLGSRLQEEAARLSGAATWTAADIHGLLGMAVPDSAVWQWPGVHEQLVSLVVEGFGARGQGPETLLAFCSLAGRLRSSGLVDAARTLFLRSGPESRLHAALGDLLKRTGTSALARTEADTPKEIVVLEPNAFFRRRILAGLQDFPIHVREAQDRAEAEALFAEAPAEVLVCETADANGPLYDWLMAQWQGGNIHRVILSTSLREPREVRESPWFHGSITKPYRTEALLDRIGL